MMTTHVISQTLTTLDRSEGRIAMGIGNSLLHNHEEKNTVKRDDNNHDNLDVESILCEKQLNRDIPGSDNKAGSSEMVMECSSNEQRKLRGKTDYLDRSYEPERMDVILAGTSPSVLEISCQPFEPKDQDKSDCFKDDRSINTVCNDKCDVTSDSGQLVLKEKDTVCDFAPKYCDEHSNNCSKHSSSEENGDLKDDHKSSTNPNSSLPILEKQPEVIPVVPPTGKKSPVVCLIDVSVKGQQCKHNELDMLKENNCNTNELKQKEKEKYINDSQKTDFSSVNGKGFCDGVQQQLDDNTIEKGVPEEVKNILENLNHWISKSSVKQMGDQNISDVQTNLSTSVLNETLDEIQNASKEMEDKQNTNHAILLVSDSKIQQETELLINKTDDKCLIGAPIQDQQCEHDDSGRLKDNKCNTNESKENEKDINNSQINFSSADASSNIVYNEVFHENVQHQVDDNSIKKEVTEEVKNISESKNCGTSNSSIREMDQNICDVSANVSTSIENESLDEIESTSEEIEDHSSPHARDGNSGENSSKRHVFLRGSFPRIVLRAGDIETMRRIQRLIRIDREKRERALNRPQFKTSIKESRSRKKQKATNGKSGNCYSEVCKNILDLTNDPKLKYSVVRIQRIDERLLAKYKVDLQSIDRRTDDNKFSNEGVSSTNHEVINLKNNKTNLQDSANYHMLRDSSFGIVENAKLPAQKVIKKVSMGSEVLKTQFKPYWGELIKPVSVQILKMDDSILSKYGYGSQKVKTSNATLIQKTENLPIAKSIRDDYNICKEMTDEQLRSNHVKYPAQICLTKIDYVYPSILQRTLKLKKTSKNSDSKKSNVNKTIKVSVSNTSDSSNKPTNLKTVHISAAKIDNVAHSKPDSNATVTDQNANISPGSIQSQEKLTSKEQTEFKHCELGNHTLNVSRTSQKRKIDSYNVVMDDFSKENVCLNGESWPLKHARVSLTKLDNSALPKFSSPCLL